MGWGTGGAGERRFFGPAVGVFIWRQIGIGGDGSGGVGAGGVPKWEGAWEEGINTEGTERRGTEYAENGTRAEARHYENEKSGAGGRDSSQTRNEAS